MGTPEGTKRSVAGSSSLIEALAGSMLDSVVFVMDYVQLTFQPGDNGGRFGRLSAYTPPTLVDPDGDLHGPGSVGYHDGLIDLVGHVVAQASEASEELRINFDDGRSLLVSVREEDSVGVEAAMLTVQDPDEWDVWRPGDIAEH